MPYGCNVKVVVQGLSEIRQCDEPSGDDLRKTDKDSADAAQTVIGIIQQIGGPVSRLLLAVRRGIDIYQGLVLD